MRLVGQSSEGVLGLPSLSIHSPLITCFRFCLSIASLAGTLLGYDARLLLTSEESSEAVFENYWSLVSHSTVDSACRLVSPQVFLRRGISSPTKTVFFSLTVSTAVLAISSSASPSA